MDLPLEDAASLLGLEAQLWAVSAMCHLDTKTKTHDLSEGNPVDSIRNISGLLTDRLTSLHSVLVRRLYLSGFAFLHVLHTRHPKIFLYVESMSID